MVSEVFIKHLGTWPETLRGDIMPSCQLCLLYSTSLSPFLDFVKGKQYLILSLECAVWPWWKGQAHAIYKKHKEKDSILTLWLQLWTVRTMYRGWFCPEELWSPKRHQQHGSYLTYGKRSEKKTQESHFQKHELASWEPSHAARETRSAPGTAIKAEVLNHKSRIQFYYPRTRYLGCHSPSTKVSFPTSWYTKPFKAWN